MVRKGGHPEIMVKKEPIIKNPGSKVNTSRKRLFYFLIKRANIVAGSKMFKGLGYLRNKRTSQRKKK